MNKPIKTSTMDATEYIKNCLKEIGFPYSSYDANEEFILNLIGGKNLVMINVSIIPKGQLITTEAMMGYRVPEEKRQAILDYLNNPNDGYDVTLYITSEGYLCGESTCKVQENMDMDFFNNTVLLPANCLVHYMPDILRTILTPNPKE